MLVLVFQGRIFKGKKCVCRGGGGGVGMFSFSHLEFEVLVGYSDGEDKIGVGGAAFMWPDPCSAGELWVERFISTRV